MGFEPRWNVKVQSVEDFVQHLQNVQTEADAALYKACDDIKCYADHKHAEAPQYEVGDTVWLSTKDFMLVPARFLKLSCQMR